MSGIAWLDHEWSTAYLDPSANGWDWVGANLDDGSALMAFQIRGKDGHKVWAYAGIRDASGRFTRFEPDQVSFQTAAHVALPAHRRHLSCRNANSNWLDRMAAQRRCKMTRNSTRGNRRAPSTGKARLLSPATANPRPRLF